MTSESWIALSTVVASTIITGFGLWLRYRERTVGFRQELYTRQVDLVVAILNAYSAVRNRMIILFDSQHDIGEQDTIWQTARPLVDALAAITPSAAAILPSAAYRAYVSLHTEARRVMSRIAYDRLPKSDLDLLDKVALSFINEVRGFLGADSLSELNRKSFIAGSGNDSVRELPREMRDVADPPSEG